MKDRAAYYLIKEAEEKGMILVNLHTEHMHVLLVDEEILHVCSTA